MDLSERIIADLKKLALEYGIDMFLDNETIINKAICRLIANGDTTPSYWKEQVKISACFKNSHLMFKNPLKEQKATPSCAA